MEYLIYILPGATIFAYYLYRRTRLAKVSRDTHEESVAAGLTEPASLHPLIDQIQCIGCGSCVAACPESPAHTVIGLIDGKASLVVAVTADLTGRFNAVDLVRLGSAALGGKGGGGRPDMAQAGGPEGARASEALAAVEDGVKAKAAA